MASCRMTAPLPLVYRTLGLTEEFYQSENHVNLMQSTDLKPAKQSFQLLNPINRFAIFSISLPKDVETVHY